jgi:polysaccharide deacetylase family protein (PEP-CTERM system associated)
MSSEIKNAFTVDYEDWFHFIDENIEADFENWKNYKTNIYEWTKEILKFLSTHNIKATFFVLGWMAEKYPELIKKIHNQGHEIGSHSYKHKLITKMNYQEFDSDLKKSMRILKKIIKKDIKVFRAPCFSITKDNLWAYEVLSRNKITIDSSVFPKIRENGGIETDKQYPHIIKTKYGEIKEYPISIFNFILIRYVFSGGGFFRISPYFILCLIFKLFKKNKKPIIFYIHPRDFFPDSFLPKNLNLFQKFKARIGQKKTFDKIEKLSKITEFCPISEIKI